MTSGSVSTVIGTIAAICTTLSFVPQVVKVRQQGGRDLSWGMLVVFLAGGMLWLTYGVLTRDLPVILANAVTAALVLAIVLLKFSAERRPRTALGDGRRPLRIAIDMDEVMADALSEHLRRYNERFGTALAASELTSHLEECVPAEHLEHTRAMIDASFFEDLPVMPGAREVVRELSERYEVIVATAAMDVPYSFDAKFRWLRRHFPFIPPSHIVYCGDKAMLQADYLIDDRARHFERFTGRPILFAAPHNRNERRYLRVADWEEVRRIFLDRLGRSPDSATVGVRRVPSTDVQPAA